MLDVVVANFPQTTVISTRYVGLYSNCAVAWDKIMSFANKHQLFEKNIIQCSNDAKTVIGLGYDDPKHTNQCRYDACLAIQNSCDFASSSALSRFFAKLFCKKATITLEKGIVKRTIKSHKCIKYIHKGPYEELKTIYPSLFELKYNLNYKLPCIEVYLNDPKTTKSSDLLTEIYIPIL